LVGKETVSSVTKILKVGGVWMRIAVSNMRGANFKELTGKAISIKKGSGEDLM